MARHLRPALMMLLLLTLITGLLYPLLVTGIGQLMFPSAANGSVIARNGRSVGSALIGQQFTSPGYFWSRPSATSPFPYNASASAGSNYGPLNPALLQSVKERIDALRAADRTNLSPVPVDLVTSSGSGLDPDISVASALYQVSRVARARHMPEAEVRALVNRYAAPRDLLVLGEARVPVVQLNLALDEASRNNR